MNKLVVRLDNKTLANLNNRAALHKRSAENEAGAILRTVVSRSMGMNLADAIQQRLRNLAESI